MFPFAALHRFTLKGTRIELHPPPFGAPAALPPAVDLSSLRVFGFLDPAIGEAVGAGRARAGDFAAIVTVGVNPEGYLFVLDAWLDRAGPSAQAARVLELHERWRYQEFGVESNLFQRLMIEPISLERERRRREGRRWDVALRERPQRSNKRLRVAALEPLARNGWLLFSDALPEEFMNQLADFPRGRHDDGPDAMEGAVALARESADKAEIEPARKGARRRDGF